MNKMDMKQKTKEDIIDSINSTTKRVDSLENCVDEALLAIVGLGNVLQCLVDRYSLDNPNMTDSEIYDYIMGRNNIYKVLNHVQMTIDRVESILEKA